MDDIPDLVTDIGANQPVAVSSAASVQTASGLAPSAPPGTKIPITIITGYLGSGKSTLLDRIGKISNKRLAIILNEFGDTSAIEKAITIQDKNESVQEWLDLGNGCLCCTVKDNGVTAIENLVENSRGKIDYILLETTGVADPAPIAKMFWLDDALSSSVYIDGVVTVVDAEHIVTCLEDVGGHWHREHSHLKQLQTTNAADLTEEELQQEADQLSEGLTTAHLQIALADCVLVNKLDRIEGDSSKLAAIEKKIHAINQSLPVYTTSFGDIALDKILDLHAFEADPQKLVQSLNYATQTVYHDDRISTVSIDFPFFSLPLGFEKVESFLQYVLWENQANGQEVEVHRTKGIMVCGDDVRVIQGVRETYDVITGGRLTEDIKSNKIVMIGKGLKLEGLKAELAKYVDIV